MRRFILRPTIMVVLAVAFSAVHAFTAEPGSSRNVVDHGAIAGGKVDVAPAIRKAIDSLPDSGGTVFIPTGVYALRPLEGSRCEFLNGSMTSPFAVEVPSNVTIRGEGPGSTILKLDLSAGKCVGFWVSGTRVRIERLAVISDKAAPNISTLWGVLLSSTERAAVEDCRFEKLSVGVQFSQVKDAAVRQCEMADCHGAGVNIQQSRACRVENSIIDGCGDGNVTIYGGNQDCHVIGCTLRNADQCGVIELSSDCSIRNCTVDAGPHVMYSEKHAGFMGIVVNRSVRAVVEGNTVRGFHHGIHVRETDAAGTGGKPNIGTRIVGNTITGIRSRMPNNPNYPVYVAYGFGTVISGNLFHDNEPPTEIRIDAMSDRNLSQANSLVGDNRFILVHDDHGHGRKAHSHPCIVSNVGVTISDNSITGYGKRPVEGFSSYLIDVGPGSIVTGNRNSGLPGLDAGGIGRFIQVGADSIVTGNFSAWEPFNGPVVNVTGDNCIVQGNRFAGPKPSALPVVATKSGQSSMVKDNMLGP